MTEFFLLTELCESRLIPSRASLKKWKEKPLRELTYLYFLAMRMLLADVETKNWAKNYAEKTAQVGDFDKWRTDGNDFYVLLHALSSDAVFIDSKRSISANAVRDWLRHTSSHDFDARTHRLFNRLDAMFHIDTTALKTLRRTVMHWTKTEARERDDALVKIIQRIKKLAPNNCELLTRLKDISQQYNDDEIAESASAGATGAASVATSIGGLGAGFDPNGKWRGVYNNKAKKPPKKVKTLIVRR